MRVLMNVFNFLVRGVKVPIYENGKWRERRRRRPLGMRDNPVAIVRDLLVKNKVVISPELDADLGKLYLYAEGKVEGFIPKSVKASDAG